MSIRDRVIQNLNEELGNDVENLKKCKKLLELYTSKKKDLEQTFTLANSEVPSKVADVVYHVEEACSRIENFRISTSDLSSKIKDQRDKTSDMVSFMEVKLKKINECEKLLCYIILLQKVKHFSDTIELSGEINGAVDAYEDLCDLWNTLAHSHCSHLIKYIYLMMTYWNNVLKNKLSVEFASHLKAINWPAMTAGVLTVPPSSDALTKFKAAVMLLLRIQLPEENPDPGVISSLSVIFPPLSLPINLLVQPFRKRFNYHFNSERQTNKIDKPEWYFTQVLTWIRDHEGFIVKWVQPVYNDLIIPKCAKVELMSGLVELVVRKLQADLDTIQYDDWLFSHTLDEALGFERDLKSYYGYPSVLPSPTSVLTRAHFFTKWIALERKFARDKMDSILSSESAWCQVSSEEKTTEAAHGFLALTSAITERYSLLTQPGHKLQFVEVEAELWDEVRVSLTQVASSFRSDPLNSPLPQVLNTISYLVVALEQATTTPMMLLLEHYRENEVGLSEEIGQEGRKETETILGLPLKLLTRLRDQILSELTERVLLEVKARSRPYRRNPWQSSDSDFGEGENVSGSVCPMLQALGDNLHITETKLTPELFEILWRDVAKEIDKFLLEELVLENTFSVKGAEVLDRDVRNGLLPLFLRHTNRPEAYFPRLLEACSLLKMESVPEIMKRGILNRDEEVVNNLKASILCRRIDLSVQLLF